jgi:opacity protein-like surface antigen
MKRFIFLFILISSFCYGQDYYNPPPARQNAVPYTRLKDTTSANNPWFFSFNLGLSVPVRDYGSKDTSHNFMIIGPDSTHGKGFANLGFHASINGGIFLSKNYGIAIKIAYNQNSFDETGLNTIINGNYDYSINSSFFIWQFMGGVFGNYQVDRNSWFWVQGMVGVIHANFPSFSIYNLPAYVAPTSLDVSWNFTFPDASNFAYSLSAGYEKAISHNVSFITTLTYSGSELVYPGLSYNLTSPFTVTNPFYTHTQSTPITMSFGSVDFSLGLIFHF